MKKITRQYKVVKSADKKTTTTEKKKKTSQVDNYISYYELFKSMSK